jgi:hydrogenase-4 transcriptional activator
MNYDPSIESGTRQELLDAWGWIANGVATDRVVFSIYERIRRGSPIQSIAIRRLNPVQRSIENFEIVGRRSQNALIQTTQPGFSEAKWTAIQSWVQTGTELRQASRKRSGKLNDIAPSSFENEVLAFPLRTSLTSTNPSQDSRRVLGIVVFEIESSRALTEDQIESLRTWTMPFWWMIELHRLNEIDRSTFIDPVRSNERVLNGRIDDAQEVIVGSESGLKAVMERVAVVANSDMPVLILGETGTGKEVVARAIHQRSLRRAMPFIRVNCGAIPSELIDSQLFGHERGSFTGASDQRKGWFERANGGTLFLDEIGELPLAAQVRLLRVLQELQIERVGGEKPIPVDVRIVAATHRDLATMVHQRTFREDLWYRVNMFPILLPRLCERENDIPALARHFAKRAAHRFGLTPVELGSTELRLLIQYRWPGNIRELQAVIDRAVILGGGHRIDVTTSLGNAFIQPRPSQVESTEPTFYEVVPESNSTWRPESPTAGRDANRTNVEIVGTLDEAIVQCIERALLTSNGQVEGLKGAARVLGINPHTLRGKMRKYHIERERFKR